MAYLLNLSTACLDKSLKCFQASSQKPVLHSAFTCYISLPSVSVAVQTAASPQCSSVRRGLHCAALLRHQDDPKNPSSSSSTTYHEHYQAHSSAQDTSASASADEGTSASTHEASEGATETGKQNTRLVLNAH